MNVDFDDIIKNHKVENTHEGINRCFNFYCIHQKDVYCQLPGISLSEQGVCQQCKMLIPDQDEAVMQYRKDHYNGR